MKATVMAVLALFGLAASPMADLKLGDAVPDLELKTMDGKTVKLSDLRGEKGKVVVIYFQAEKCPSALNPDVVKKIAEKYEKDDSKVKFIAVWSFKGDSDERVKAFVEKNAVKYAVVQDHGKKVAEHFGAKQVNTTFVLDKDGKLVYRGGFLPSKKVSEAAESAVEAAVNGKKAPPSDGKFNG